MPCYRPLHGWRSRIRNKSGKRSIVFNRKLGFEDMPVTVPCGQCRGCRLERSRQHAIRCMCESQMHDENCFLTLTYDDDHLPLDGSLDKSHFQKFMKRLRREFSDRKISYFHCGEYGENFDRPHYHACIFGFNFPDRKLFKCQKDNFLYVSDILNRLWGNGYCVIGDVTFESAAYVARYIMKKVTGDDALDHYKGRVPEYVTMSLKPAIGKNWFKKFSDDVFPDDFVVMRGRKIRPPRYFDKLFDIDNHREMCLIKERRKKEGEKHELNNREDRLDSREKCLEGKIKFLKRSFENA